MIITKDFGADVLTRLRALYESAFPSSEKKPFSLIDQKCGEGSAEIYAILGEDGGFLGLAIFILHDRLALLDYFAIEEGERGRGIGGEALERIKNLHGERVLLLEIEDVDEPDAENRADRVRRERFYTSHGMRIMPYRISLFGVQMRVLTSGKVVDFAEYHRIFENVFSPKAAENVKLI